VSISILVDFVTVFTLSKIVVKARLTKRPIVVVRSVVIGSSLSTVIAAKVVVRVAVLTTLTLWSAEAVPLSAYLIAFLALEELLFPATVAVVVVVTADLPLVNRLRITAVVTGESSLVEAGVTVSLVVVEAGVILIKLLFTAVAGEGILSHSVHLFAMVMPHEWTIKKRRYHALVGSSSVERSKQRLVSSLSVT
jgi:hypothetical protein